MRIDDFGIPCFEPADGYGQEIKEILHKPCDIIVEGEEDLDTNLWGANIMNADGEILGYLENFTNEDQMKIVLRHNEKPLSDEQWKIEYIRL